MRTYSTTYTHEGTGKSYVLEIAVLYGANCGDDRSPVVGVTRHEGVLWVVVHPHGQAPCLINFYEPFTASLIGDYRSLADSREVPAEQIPVVGGNLT